MRRVPTILILTIVSSVLAPVVVSATGAAQDKVATTVQLDKAPTTVVRTSTGGDGAAACTRRVKVVYAGYGEGQGAPCTVTATVQR
jgi:hypothetical protein